MERRTWKQQYDSLKTAIGVTSAACYIFLGIFAVIRVINLVNNTIGDVVYMGMKNDLSILVSENISLYRAMELYELQSTYNPNMPVRELIYAGKLYDKFIHSAGLNRYGRKLLPLPLPKLVTFYNGDDTG